MNETKITKKQFNFDVITAHIEKIMNKRDCNNVLFRLQVNDALEQLKIIFWREFMGKRQEKIIYFYVPKTWKDHFKKNHKNKKWMKWWVRRHPIKNKKLSFKIEKITVFPDVIVPYNRDYKEKFSYIEFYPGKAWREENDS